MLHLRRSNSLARPASSGSAGPPEGKDGVDLAVETPSTATTDATTDSGVSPSLDSPFAEDGTMEVEEDCASDSSGEVRAKRVSAMVEPFEKCFRVYKACRKAQFLPHCIGDKRWKQVLLDSPRPEWQSMSVHTGWLPAEDASSRARAPPPVGLANLGNTCFMNAALQARRAGPGELSGIS